MKKHTIPLWAVIENTESRLHAGRQPVMTVLKPMGWFARLLYRLTRRRPTTEIDIAVRPASTSYVVELDDRLFALLAGGKHSFPNAKGDGEVIQVVLTPSLELKARHSAELDGDARP